MNEKIYNEILSFKPFDEQDENSGVKWFELEKIRSVVSEANMIPYYEKLNNKIYYI